MCTLYDISFIQECIEKPAIHSSLIFRPFGRLLLLRLSLIHIDVYKRQKQDSYNRLQEYTNQIESMYSSLRSFKHDYSNIMLSMSEYFEANDMEGLRSYFNKEILPLSRKITKNTAHINQLMNIKTVSYTHLILLVFFSQNILLTMPVNLAAAILLQDGIIIYLFEGTATTGVTQSIMPVSYTHLFSLKQ